jgi:LPXTG-site transpeptidase (sortase) family protein
MSEPTDNGQSPDPTNGAHQADWPSAGVGSRAPTATRKEAAPKRAAASLGFLLDATRRRRGGRLFLWFLVGALALSGIGLLAYPVVTDLWADRIQGNLENQFAQHSEAEINAYKTRNVGVGQALTRLRINRLGVAVIVVEGISGNALRAGAGHYEQSALPGDPTGNVAIAGHRTGFGEPFRHLELLRDGDEIELATPVGRFVYKVIGAFDGHQNPWITSSTDWSVISPTPEPSLTLTTCDPPGTSLNRLIVRARLDHILPA